MTRHDFCTKIVKLFVTFDETNSNYSFSVFAKILQKDDDKNIYVISKCFIMRIISSSFLYQNEIKENKVLS